MRMAEQGTVRWIFGQWCRNQRARDIRMRRRIGRKKGTYGGGELGGELRQMATFRIGTFICRIAWTAAQRTKGWAASSISLPASSPLNATSKPISLTLMLMPSLLPSPGEFPLFPSPQQTVSFYAQFFRFYLFWSLYFLSLISSASQDTVLWFSWWGLISIRLW